MKNLLALFSLFLSQTAYAALASTSLRLDPGFSPALTKPEQIDKMQVHCVFKDQSKVAGTIQVDAQDAQKLEVDFQYQTAKQTFELSTKKGNIKKVEVALSEHVIDSNGLGRGPNPWLMIEGNQEQFLSFEMTFWLGEFQMIHSGKNIVMKSKEGSFVYVEYPVHDENNGKCVWEMGLR